MSRPRQPHYGIRPGKHVERKMMCETFARLATFAPLRTYRYIGFGSYYFRDFILVHRMLGITDFIDIEGDIANRDRYEFNKPYRCIEIKFGMSHEVLPGLPLDEKRTIMWLDYVGNLNGPMLNDINLFATKARSGSVLAVSLRAEPTPVNNQPRAELATEIGEDRVPEGVVDKDFAKWGTAQIYWRVIRNEIEEAMRGRNGGLSIDQQMVYKQVFHFHYNDGTQMLTVGGVFHRRGDESLLQFGGLDFLREGKDPYPIIIPGFTFREMRYMDQQLPLTGRRKLRLAGVPTNDLAHYARLYRFFPNFSDVEV